MKLRKQLFAAILLGAVATQSAGADNDLTFRSWAPTPPMGWNSWDCYYSSVTEKEVMQNAQYLISQSLETDILTIYHTRWES